MKTLKETVDWYVSCGNAHGFALAEMILSHFTPPGCLEGKCYDVPEGLRGDFVKALQDPENFLRIQRERREAARKAVQL